MNNRHTRFLGITKRGSNEDSIAEMVLNRQTMPSNSTQRHIQRAIPSYL
ncbi:hypothetical protein QW060_25050 [Myroides ceti]|uniref:Uncharacterized protein n=1 Tax=Paenimyroides ceti TaxID=395087 RepID=A0ABT8CZY1_9FLAO|nr:hypothetical protein [Paenimyroides ceti]MDN3707169.1 hypothetical protein [Paenimyroides ceti]MDN3710148.1 hypothetical protein [Paenimyroides ceti]